MLEQVKEKMMSRTEQPDYNWNKSKSQQFMLGAINHVPLSDCTLRVRPIVDTGACFGTKNTAFDVEHDQFQGCDAGAVGKTAGSPGAETTGTDLKSVVVAGRCSAGSTEKSPELAVVAPRLL